MTNEEMVKKINEFENKNFLTITPKEIRGGLNLVYDYDSLLAYENRDEATREYAAKTIVNFMSSSQEKRDLDFRIIFCGDFDELGDDHSIEGLLSKKKDRIILAYSTVSFVTSNRFFIGFSQEEKINHYKHTYLNYELLEKLFNENGLDFELLGRKSVYDDDSITYFTLKKREKEDKEGIQKVKNDK